MAGDAAQLVKSAAARAANELLDPDTGKAIASTVAKAGNEIVCLSFIFDHV